MREKYKYAGKTVKIKGKVGVSSFGEDLSNKQFRIEDWAENVLGCSWLDAQGNPAALEYVLRIGFFGKNNNVNLFSNDVLYGKVGMFGHLFHVNELELPE